MAFRDFTFPDVGRRLGLSIQDGRLFSDTPDVAVRPELVETLTEGVTLSSAIDTEKARSEFVIAPILFEMKRFTRSRFRLFSGVDWDVDRERGLNGVCDFVLTWGPSQHFLSAPFAAVVESKRFAYHTGFGQCMAAMHAAVIANERAGLPIHPVHGAVTYGAGWKFLRLDGTAMTIDEDEYTLADLPRLMGVLDFITRRPAALAA